MGRRDFIVVVPVPQCGAFSLKNKHERDRGRDPPSVDGLRNQIKVEPDKKDYRMMKNVLVV
jgi:hypothetical protein